MKKLLLTKITSLILFAAFAQPQTILFSVGDDNVTVDEFQYIYEKNNSIHKDEKLYSRESLDEYLDLYIKFKLKVVEAKSLGLDTTEKFIKEYTMYRGQLAKPYLTDKKVTEKLVTQAYDRMQWVLRASHILIDVEEDAFPSDTLKAYNLAMKAKKKVQQKSVAFDKVAREYSKYTKDPTVDQTGGDIGYFSVFTTVFPFEEASYSSKIGEVVGPIRTSFGYHIIKITEKRPYMGDMNASHIMMMVTESDDIAKQSIAKARIDSIYNKLQNGENFGDLAKKYSEHYATAQSGGELRSFNFLTNNYPRVFVNEVYDLKKDGEYTKPFKTDYGWHIAKRNKITPLGEFDDMEHILTKKIDRDSRSQLSRTSAIEKIRSENRVSVRPEATQVFRDEEKEAQAKARLQEKEGKKPPVVTKQKTSVGQVPNEVKVEQPSEIIRSILEGNWIPDSKKAYGETILTINKETYTQKDFAEYLEKMQMPGKFKNSEYAIDYYFERFVDDMILNYEDRHLESKYPEFRNIAKEYKEGILLFEISDQEVWSKAVKDTTGLKKYYENNTDSFMWKKRADAVILYCNDEATAKKIKKKLAKDNSNLDELFKEMNGENSMSFSYSNDVFEEGENDVLNKIKWKKKGFRKLEDHDGRYVLVKFNKVMKPEPKELSEIRGLVIADYQDFLEEKWVKELKKKYPVKQNQQAVDTLYK